MVIENTTPATVMTAAAIAIRIWRATSGPPELTQDGSASRPVSASRSRRVRHDKQTGDQHHHKGSAGPTSWYAGFLGLILKAVRANRRGRVPDQWWVVPPATG